jgi:hypothetical protein
LWAASFRLTDHRRQGSDRLLRGQTGQVESRSCFVIYVGNDVHAAKWRNWKMMVKEMDSGDSAVRELSLPHFHNLLVDQ